MSRTSSVSTRIAGHATGAGTRRLADRHAAQYSRDFYRDLGDVRVGSIGLGTYLGAPDDADDARYAAVLNAALGAGVNLIDSSINYRYQRSERTIGRALREAIDAGDIARDEVVLCTKGGYIALDGAPPATREEYVAFLEREYYEPGIMRPEDLVAGGHSLAPKFLADQIARSRENLGVERIDVYYLHNPEQQLDATERNVFRSRLRAAFAALEAHVAAGEIGCYGCATWNGLRVPPEKRGHLSLAELVGIARETAGEEHHFRVVQMPVNLAMAEAVRQPTQRIGSANPITALEAAERLGLGVVASAPLLQARLTSGLPAQLGEAFPALRTDAQRALAFTRTLPGVTAALVGMRELDHLRENLASAPIE